MKHVYSVLHLLLFHSVEVNKINLLHIYTVIRLNNTFTALYLNDLQPCICMIKCINTCSKGFICHIVSQSATSPEIYHS